MILLFNVKITSTGLSYYHREWHVPRDNRLDIFKYCLASHAALLPTLTKCIFYIELAPEFGNRQAELEEYISKLFPTDKLELHWYRINYTRDWREMSQQFTDDDIIWYAGNDDHIFIDYDLDLVYSGIKTLQQDPDPLSVIIYSHWSEQVNLANYYHGELTADGDYIKFVWDEKCAAVALLTGARFKKYWQDNQHGDHLIFRSDGLYQLIGYQIHAPQYTPTRELVRHYDGYWHVNRADMGGIAPPLFIPPGFFNNAIQIKIGYSARDSKYTNFNPKLNLFAADYTGADYRWVKEDIPLFWQDKISDIDTSSDYDIIDNYIARDQAFLKMTRVPMCAYDITFTADNAAPLAWFNKYTRHVKN